MSAGESAVSTKSVFDPLASFHQPFTWLSDGVEDDPAAIFVALTKDVCAGIQVCLELIESSDLDRANNENADRDAMALPTMSQQTSRHLMRFARAASVLLKHEADARIEWLRVHHHNGDTA